MKTKTTKIRLQLDQEFVFCLCTLMNSSSVSQKKPEELRYITVKIWLIIFYSYKRKSTFLDAETEGKEEKRWN